MTQVSASSPSTADEQGHLGSERRYLVLHSVREANSAMNGLLQMTVVPVLAGTGVYVLASAAFNHPGLPLASAIFTAIVAALVMAVILARGVMCFGERETCGALEARAAVATQRLLARGEGVMSKAMRVEGTWRRRMAVWWAEVNRPAGTGTDWVAGSYWSMLPALALLSGLLYLPLSRNISSLPMRLVIGLACYIALTGLLALIRAETLHRARGQLEMEADH